MTDSHPADTAESPLIGCPACHARSPRSARRCRACGATLEVRADEVPWRSTATGTPERPLGEDRKFFDAAGPGNLADRPEGLLDEQGEDIRQYTGEPVETDEGWVLPRQQNVGPGNMAGGGEWPDPNAPPAQSDDGPASDDGPRSDD